MSSNDAFAISHTYLCLWAPPDAVKELVMLPQPYNTEREKYAPMLGKARGYGKRVKGIIHVYR